MIAHKPITCVWSLDKQQFVLSTYKILHMKGLCVSDLGLVLAEARQGEGRLWVDELMVDVSQ